MAAISAKYARVILNATPVLATKWTINTKVEELDISNMEGNGYSDYIGGLWDADISADCIWDTTGSPFNLAPFLVPGKVISNSQFFLSNTANAVGVGLNVQVPPTNLPVPWVFSAILITQVNMDTEIRGVVKFSFMGKNKGTWSVPTA